MKKTVVCLMFVLFAFCFGVLEVHADEPVVGGKNNFETARPIMQNNASISSNSIKSRDANNPFRVVYEFDLSKYEQSINDGEFEMDFRAGSDSWYRNEKKGPFGIVINKWAYERPVLSVYIIDNKNFLRYLFNHDNSGGSNDGKDYIWNGKLPANTKTIGFEFDSAADGDYRSSGFGACYNNMFLSFKDKGNVEDTYVNKPVLGEKNNFEVAKPTYEKNATITSNRISSKDGNNPFEVTYVFDLSEYKQIINEGKFEMEFKSGSESWYQHHVKQYLYQKGKRTAYERPILTVYTTDYNNGVKNLIYKSHSGESSNGKNYNLDVKLPANTKTITFQFNSEYGGAHGATGFGGCYKNMELFFTNDFKDEYKKFTILKGKLISDYGIGYGILLDNKIKVKGKSVEQIYLEGINVDDYLDRSCFTYQIYSYAVLKDECNGILDIEVYVDKNSFEYCEEVGETLAEAKKIISLNGEKNPKYKANENYPIDFYIDTFWWHLNNLSLNDITYTSDIKDFAFYKEIPDFKNAVDKILEKGFFIQMAEGEYMINETEEKYSDGEIDSPTVFNIEDLKNGDTLSGDMIIDNIKYKKASDKVEFDLIGETLVFGNITYDSEYYEGYILTVDDPYLFNIQIKVDFPENYTFNYEPKFLLIRNEDFISAEYKKALKQGKKLEGKISIKDISFGAIYQSESVESCELVDFLDVSMTD